MLFKYKMENINDPKDLVYLLKYMTSSSLNMLKREVYMVHQKPNKEIPK